MCRVMHGKEGARIKQRDKLVEMVGNTDDLDALGQTIHICMPVVS